MSFIRIPESIIPLTGNGTTTGYVTIDINAYSLNPGTVVNLYSLPAGSLECVVTEVRDNGEVGLRARPTTADTPLKVHYGRNDVSAWLVADNAVLCVEKQLVPMQPLAQAKPA
jgi:hypothetical protein